MVVLNCRSANPTPHQLHESLPVATHLDGRLFVHVVELGAG